MELGWALPRRAEHLRNAERGAEETFRIRFQGDLLTRKLFSVPAGLPKYRLENGRTVSLQAEWLADHSDERPDFFRGDPESDRAQEEQHNLLLKLIKGKGLREFFSNPANKQVDPVILDSHGFVVNGNFNNSFYLYSLFYKNHYLSSIQFFLYEETLLFNCFSTLCLFCQCSNDFGRNSL